MLLPPFQHFQCYNLMMNVFRRRSYFDPRHCSHTEIRGIYGDEIHACHGYRLQCLDCKSFLEGPAALANVVRDPQMLLSVHREVVTKHHEHSWELKHQGAGPDVVICTRCDAWESVA